MSRNEPEQGREPERPITRDEIKVSGTVLGI